MERSGLGPTMSQAQEEWGARLAQAGPSAPDWRPLEAVLRPEWCGGFMFMGRAGDIRLYKHGFTRRYMNLDSGGKAYRFDGDGYAAMSLEAAIDHVFAGLHELGRTRESVYDDAATRCRKDPSRGRGGRSSLTKSLSARGRPAVESVPG